MTTIEFLNSPVARALGWTLLHAVWQGFALVLPTAFILYLLRRRSSELRYRLGSVVLAGQLLLSVATFIWYYQPSAPAGSFMRVPVSDLSTHWPVSIQPFMARPLPWPQQVLVFLETHLSEFVCVYLMGIVLLGLRLAGGWLHLHQLRRSAVASALSTERILVERLRKTLTIRSTVLIRESARTAVPMVIGALKPMLLLPMGLATGLSNRELEAVLAHELAHIKRYDYAVNLLQSIVETLYFFHPALWWLSARVREEREHCCDDLAVQVCGDNGRALAQALARIEEMRLDRVAVPALAMAFSGRRQVLLYRVQRVLGLSTRSMVSNRSLAGLTLATLLLVSVSVYAVQQQDTIKQPRLKAATPARRSSSASSTELRFDNNRKLTAVIWKGQKLPASRVANLQQQWNQVMTGQVNLDDIPQPDRDILLNAIESQYGKISSSEQEKYQAIAEAALQTIPLSPDGTVEGLAKANYDSIIQTAFPSISPSPSPGTDTSDLNAVHRQLELLSQKMQAIMDERKPLVDRMSKEMTELTLKYTGVTKEARKLQEQQMQLATQQSALASKQLKLSHQLRPLQTEINRLSTQRTKESQRTLAQKHHQREQLEKEMDALGSKMGDLGSKMGDLGTELESRLEPYQQRMGILADSISKLYEPTYALSEKIAELSGQIAEESNARAEKAMEAANKLMEQTMNLSSDVNAPAPARRLRSKPARARHRVIEGDVIAPTPPVPPAAPLTPPYPPTMATPARPARPATPPKAIKGRVTIPVPPASPNN